MNKLDIIVITILVIYFVLGIRNGFLRTLIGPASLFIGSIIAFIYYKQSESFLWALLISIMAPLTVNLVLIIFLKILHKTLGIKKELTLLSRCAGGLIATVWSGAWILLTLIFLVITPCEWSWFDRLQDGVLNSRTYAAINTIVGDKIPRTSTNVRGLSEMLQNPRKFRVLKNTTEYKELARHETIIELLSNKETMKQIQHQDIPKLLSNPKFQALLSDKELIEKVFMLQRKLIELETQKAKTQEADLLSDTEAGKDLVN